MRWSPGAFEGLGTEVSDAVYVKGTPCPKKKIPQYTIRNCCRIFFSSEKYTEPDFQLCHPLAWIKKKVDRAGKQARSLNPAL